MANKRRSRGKGQTGRDSEDKRKPVENGKDNKFRDVKLDCSNDVAWYAQNPELLRSAASLPFSTVTGDSLPFSTGDAVPGVCGIYYVPAIGPNINSFKPANQAANSMYSFTVHANSRNQSYDAPDEMLLVLAGAQLMSFLALGIRCYGVAKLYDQRNNYLPDALIQAMGFDPASVRNSLSQMWFDLNEFIARAAQIWIPNTMPLIARWYWMNSNVYMDGDSVKAQYYLYAPAQVYKYDETKYTQGGCLTPIAWDSSAQSRAGSGATWAQYKAALNSLFDALLDSQDRGIIFGDILKAYGQDRIWSLHEIPSDYTVVPVHDREVLSQIENSVGIKVKLGDIHQVTPTPGAVELILWQDPYNGAAPTMANGDYCPSRAVLNFHQKEIPTPEQIMVATRMMALRTVATQVSGGSTYDIYPQMVGTEYVYDYGLMNRNAAGQLISAHYTSVLAGSSFNEPRAFRYGAMDWTPFMYTYTSDPTPGSQIIPTTNPDHAIGEYDQWTVVEYETLGKMHETAVYSEFGVPVLMV